LSAAVAGYEGSPGYFMTFASNRTERPLALVTGASSGIGVELARELARDGHDLILVARRENPMRDLAIKLSAFGVNTTVIAANLGVISAASYLATELRDRGLDALDVLVNNAGFGDYQEFSEAEPTKLAEMIQLNVTTLTELTRLILPDMLVRRRGRILFVGALAGFMSGPGAAVYHATKAYVVSLGSALGSELRGTGVTVTTVCPGPTKSGFGLAAGLEADIGDTRVGLMTSRAVAQRAYQALKEGRCIEIPGLRNKIQVAWARLATRMLIRASAVKTRP
jgi:uncharacterized protein